MNGKFQAATLLALVLAWTYPPTGSATFVPRCLCYDLVNKVRLHNVTDYLIIPKDAHCSSTQIILVINSNNVEMEVCLNPNSHQGRHLAACWERIDHNIDRKKQCLQVPRRRVAEP